MSEGESITKMIRRRVNEFYRDTGRQPNMIIIGEEILYKWKGEKHFMRNVDYEGGGFEFCGLPIYRSSRKEDLHVIKIGCFYEKGYFV